jgi:hypothetical protein
MIILDNTEKIIRYLEGLSYFIEEVCITKVENWTFHFKVKLPWWFKFFLGWFVEREIKRLLTPRLPVGVKFEFTLYSTNLF